jgi:rare lipoprotein A
MKILIVLLLILTSIQAHAETGMASWYGHESGKYTANGERFNPHGMTAATWSWPFNTWLKVTCLKTGKYVTVRVSDRGPARRLHRTIDLSEEAAKRLGIKHIGIAKVLVEELH